MSNATDRSCHPLPDSTDLSLIISPLVGYLVGAMSTGPIIAFAAGFNSWLASLRVLMVGVWAVHEAVNLRSLQDGEQFFAFYNPYLFFRLLFAYARHKGPFGLPGIKKHPPGAVGWIGWIVPCLYATASPILWILGNWHANSPGAKFARALGLSVIAYPLTADTRARYGDVLEERFGVRSRYAFNLITAFSILILGVESAILLLMAAIGFGPDQMVLIYVPFMLAFTSQSFWYLRPLDEGCKLTVVNVLAGLVMAIPWAFFVTTPGYNVLYLPGTPAPGCDILRG